MKKTIQTFLDSGKVAITGASPNKDNFGRTLMIEQSVGSGIKRVWMVRGIGKGAYSEKAHTIFSRT